MKVAKFAIFLTGMMGLAMGGLMTISSLKHEQDQSQLRLYDQLKSESQILVDQFYSAIESAKSLSIQNAQGTNPSVSSLPYVTHAGIVKLEQSQPKEFESLSSKEAFQLGIGKDGKALESLPDLALEDRVLKSIQNGFSLSDLQISRFLISTYAIAENGNKEGIVLATPIYKSAQGVADPTQIEKLNIVLLDPSKVMASLSKMNSDRRRAYLISREGRVLAHSIDSFIGTDLKRMDSLRESIENLFLGAQTGVVTQYASSQGAKEQVAFVRAGIYPFAVAAEQNAPAAVLSAAWLSEQAASGAARKNLGMIFVLIAIALAAFAAVSFIARRLEIPARPSAVRDGLRVGLRDTAAESNLSDQGERESNESRVSTSFQRWAVTPPVGAPWVPSSRVTPPLTPPSAPPLTSPNSTQASLIASAATEQFVENRAQIDAENRVRELQAKKIVITKDYEREFADRIKKQYTPEAIEKELTQVSSELTESPVLYFRYHRQTQNLNLASVAGQVQIPNYALMQAYVRKDIEQQVERLANEGKVASVSNYGPISKLMMSNLNIAHFEAWVVNSDPETSGTSRMVGVLVILQAGFRSAQTRPILANIIKEAGNYLYAQNSKLRPRRYENSELNL
jgi:hypothetical protein